MTSLTPPAFAQSRETVELPHGLRPAVGSAPSPDASSASYWPLVALVGLAALGVILSRWLRGRPEKSAAVPGPDSFQGLADHLGTSDWYERLGQHLVPRDAGADAHHLAVAAILSRAATKDKSGHWSTLYRRWEWAIYGGYPGQADDHRADLAVARRGWP